MSLPPIQVVTRGATDAPPVLALHSSGSEGRQWAALVDALPDHYVLLPELHGHAAAPAWRGPALHFDDQVESLVPVLDALDRPAVLVGHSLGGLVALRLAARRPTRVAALALYEPVVFGLLHDPPAELADARRLMTTFDLWDPDAPEPFLEAFVGYWSGEGIWSILPEARRAVLRRIARPMHDEAKAVTFDRTPASFYAGLTMPAIVVHGTTSPAAASAMARRLVAALPRATRRCLEGASHMGPIAEPERFREAIAEVLGNSR